MSNQPYNKTLNTYSRFKSGYVTSISNEKNLTSLNKQIPVNYLNSTVTVKTQETPIKLTMPIIMNKNYEKGESIDTINNSRRETKVKFSHTNLVHNIAKCKERNSEANSITHSISNEISNNKTEDKTKFENLSYDTQLTKAASVAKISITRDFSIINNTVLNGNNTNRLTARASGQLNNCFTYDKVFNKVNHYSTKNLNYLINLEVSKKDKSSVCGSNKSIVSKNSFNSRGKAPSKLSSLKENILVTLQTPNQTLLKSDSKAEIFRDDEQLKTLNQSDFFMRNPSFKRVGLEESSIDEMREDQYFNLYKEQDKEDSVCSSSSNQNRVDAPSLTPKCIEQVVNETSNEDLCFSSRQDSLKDGRLSNISVKTVLHSANIEDKVKFKNIEFEANSFKNKLLLKSISHLALQGINHFSKKQVTTKHNLEFNEELVHSELVKDLIIIREKSYACSDIYIKDELKAIQSFPYINKLVDKLYFTSTRDRLQLTDFITSSNKPDSTDIWHETRTHLFNNFSKNKEKENIINKISLRPTQTSLTTTLLHNPIVTRLVNHEMNLMMRDIDLNLEELVNNDIPERKQVEEKIQLSKNRKATVLNYKRQLSLNGNIDDFLMTRSRKKLLTFKCDPSHRKILDMIKPSLLKMFEYQLEKEEENRSKVLRFLENSKRFILKRKKPKLLFQANADIKYKIRRVLPNNSKCLTRRKMSLDEIISTNTLKMKVKFVISSSLIQRLFFYIYERNFEAFRIEFEAHSVNPDKINHTTERSLLIDAIMCENVEIVKYLISKGASVNLPDKDGNFPIHHAAQIRNYAIIDLLINKNASQSEKNSGHLNVWEILSKE